MKGEKLLKNVNVKVEKVSVEVFNKMAYREESDGLIALSRPKDLSLNKVILSTNPFVILLESVEKPGNLGAILRTADAANVDAVIVCDPKTDVYNPNTIRSSIGCVFTRQVVACTSQDALKWLKQNNFCVFASEPVASESYYIADFKKPTAIVLGSEADGLSEFWISNADQRIKIPMKGYSDSLNVSVSAAILTFEAMRQRNI